MATDQDRENRNQQQREKLKLRLENLLNVGKTAEAQQLINDLGAKGHKTQVVTALREIDHKDAQRMLKALAPNSSGAKTPAHKTSGSNRLLLVGGGILAVAVVAILIGVLVLPKLNQPATNSSSNAAACASGSPDIGESSVSLGEASTYDIPDNMSVSLNLPTGWVSNIWEWGQAVTFASSQRVKDRGGNPLISGDVDGSVTVIIKGSSKHPSMPAFAQFSSIDEVLKTMPAGTEVNRLCVNGKEAFTSTSKKTDARGTETQMAGFMDVGEGFVFLLFSIPEGEIPQQQAAFNAILKSIQTDASRSGAGQPT